MYYSKCLETKSEGIMEPSGTSYYISHNCVAKKDPNKPFYEIRSPSTGEWKPAPFEMYKSIEQDFFGATEEAAVRQINRIEQFRAKKFALTFPNTLSLTKVANHIYSKYTSTGWRGIIRLIKFP